MNMLIGTIRYKENNLHDSFFNENKDELIRIPVDQLLSFYANYLIQHKVRSYRAPIQKKPLYSINFSSC